VHQKDEVIQTPFNDKCEGIW